MIAVPQDDAAGSPVSAQAAATPVRRSESTEEAAVVSYSAPCLLPPQEQVQLPKHLFIEEARALPEQSSAIRWDVKLRTQLSSRPYKRNDCCRWWVSRFRTRITGP